MMSECGDENFLTNEQDTNHSGQHSCEEFSANKQFPDYPVQPTKEEIDLVIKKCPSILRGTEHVLPKLTREAETIWRGEFFFVQAADCQFGLLERYVENKPEPRGWEEEKRRAELAVAKVNSMKPPPRFMVICGDLIDAYPGQKDRQGQLKTFYEVFKHLSVPLVCVCGNHDVGERPTIGNINEYNYNFGDDYFSFWVSGCRFLVLNSQFFVDASAAGDLGHYQNFWMEQHLSIPGPATHTFVIQHIPLFVNDPDEPKEYFNIEPEKRKNLLDRFSRAGVTAVFSGHYHRNGGGMYNGMEQVVTSAIGAQLGNDEPGLRVVRVFEKKIKHEYFALSDIPTTFNP